MTLDAEQVVDVVRLRYGDAPRAALTAEVEALL